MDGRHKETLIFIAIGAAVGAAYAFSRSRQRRTVSSITDGDISSTVHDGDALYNTPYTMLPGVPRTIIMEMARRDIRERVISHQIHSREMEVLANQYRI